MSVFTARKLKEARVAAHLSQEEVANKLKISERKIRALEADQNPLSVDDLLDFAKLNKVDVRELILESYVESGEEQILCNRYASPSLGSSINYRIETRKMSSGLSNRGSMEVSDPVL